MELKIKTTALTPSTTLIKLEGEMDISSAPQLKSHITQSLTDVSKNIIIDLSTLLFTDSVGIGVIIGGIQQAKELGGKFLSLPPSRQVKRLMDIVGIFQILPVYETTALALKEIQS